MRAERGTFVVLILAWGIGSASAQGVEPNKDKGAAEKKEQATTTTQEDSVAEDSATAPAAGNKGEAPVQTETSLDACRDGEDNDGDGQVDCADQECQIYAICVERQPEPGEAAGENDEDGEETVEEPPSETGLQCRDKMDNDGDGLVDCHDDTCQRYSYCRRLMYETPMPPNKAPALYISLGAGLALPNFRTPTATTARFVPYNREIPFDPDIGVTAGMKLGYFPLKWLGVGANFNVTGTGATNQYDGFFKRDDPDLYRYNGTKIAGHVGGFVRLQWPLKRFVPFLDISMGYSVAKYTWNVYDSDTSWSDIEAVDEDDEWLSGETASIEYEVVSRHFTFALEPGFDVFVVKRVFALGAHAWLPVVASNESSTDNVGLLLHLTVTPLWRGSKRLKAEYQKEDDK